MTPVFEFELIVEQQDGAQAFGSVTVAVSAPTRSLAENALKSFFRQVEEVRGKVVVQ